MSATMGEFATWTGCRDCVGGPTPGARALLAYWLEWSAPVGSSMGIYACRDVRGGSSMSIHACGRAADLGVPVTDRGHDVAYRFLNLIGPHVARLGVQLAIFDRTYGSSRNPWPTPYRGVHPHRNHIHMELTPAAGARLTLATLRAVLGSAEEDDVYVVRFGNKTRDPRVQRVQRIVEAVGREYLGEELLPDHGPDGYYGTEMRDAVNRLCRMAKIPETGDEGMDVLVLDYARHLLTHARRIRHEHGDVEQ